VARALGTRHVEVPCTEETLGEALREAVQRVAEPLGDPALLPVILLGREARRHVTVILSGEGADELFGGYPTYLGHKVAPWLLALPRGSRAALRSLVNRLPSSGRKVTVEYLLKRFMADLEAPWPERHLNWFGTGFASLDGVQPGTLADILASRDRRGDLRGAMLLDYLTYLPDDLLFKVDRGLMLHSVEARAPFLDRDVTAFALSLPAAMRVRGFTTKWLLKKAAAAWLPADVINRRKRGLGVPVADWMRRGLRPEVGRLLHTDRLAAQGILDATLVGGLVAEHNSGAANHARALWPLIMLQYWLERWT
jgi:asparagine synthase (glutamine-hydrolysing)